MVNFVVNIPNNYRELMIPWRCLTIAMQSYESVVEYHGEPNPSIIRIDLSYNEDNRMCGIQQQKKDNMDEKK